MLAFIKSRTGYLLSCSNMLVLTLWFWDRGPFSSDSGIHPYNEPLLIQLALLLNLPSLIVAGIVLFPILHSIGISVFDSASWVYWVSWIMSIWLQWQFIGYLVDSISASRAQAKADGSYR